MRAMASSAVESSFLSFYPIDMLPVVARLVDEEVAEVNALILSMIEAERRPGKLDLGTIERIITMYGAVREDVDLYDEQLRRWSRLELTRELEQEVERLLGQAEALKAGAEYLVSMGRKLKQGLS